MNRPIENLLARLDAVKETSRGKWQARCPSHDDKQPSLSIKETNDGVVLLKCWSGCNASEIVGAVGLELSDLFPKHENFDHSRRQVKQQKPFNAMDALRAIIHETTIVAVCAGMLKSDGLSPDDSARLALAIQRLFAAGSAVGA
jgi:DNA primase